jgi:hypothetical protein
MKYLTRITLVFLSSWMNITVEKIIKEDSVLNTGAMEKKIKSDPNFLFDVEKDRYQIQAELICSGTRIDPKYIESITRSLRAEGQLSNAQEIPYTLLKKDEEEKEKQRRQEDKYSWIKDYLFSFYPDSEDLFSFNPDKLPLGSFMNLYIENNYLTLRFSLLDSQLEISLQKNTMSIYYYQNENLQEIKKEDLLNKLKQIEEQETNESYKKLITLCMEFINDFWRNYPLKKVDIIKEKFKYNVHALINSLYDIIKK